VQAAEQQGVTELFAPLKNEPIADVKKFTDYLFKPGVTHGKDAVFSAYGYGAEHSAQLATDFTHQANSRYGAGDFVRGFLDKYGQRLHIPIDLFGQGAAAGTSTTISTGWRLNSDGSLSLDSPFSGFWQK